MGFALNRMMKPKKLLALMAGMFLTLSVSSNVVAQASDKDRLETIKEAQAMVLYGKTYGMIGESATGYLDFVVWDSCASVPPAVLSARGESCKVDHRVYKAVQTINDVRKSQYEAIGYKQNADSRSVGSMFGKRLMKNAKPGEKVKTKTGKWRIVQ